ncbi:uncharacterized protein GGS22DRAFT_165301 [Annulohypoxylon maeteangense]|uniref:uncharacterized protein n=1 Tax=Annulohypoxylon maeteangense TaxID=1927788 RepID=UPI0020088654|nr:uncharacterized protein GGS22DRAFT_165301 [Annulohypoxylon maeteangense]KAI0884294.1 hypothetical protein GGS22DRAFT_165301 [Annulohypoxylon maeteangense]
MKFSAAIMGAALVASGVSAQKAIVKNNCGSTIYVQSFPYDGTSAGPLTTLTAGQTFSEDFRAAGSTVKIATTKTLNSPLFFGYSFTKSPDYAYYEFSSEWGNPFANSANTLGAGEGCESFSCAAGQAGCYSQPAAKKVYGCPQPVDLEAVICA